jgi:hypothetical protein
MKAGGRVINVGSTNAERMPFTGGRGVRPEQVSAAGLGARAGARPWPARDHEESHFILDRGVAMYDPLLWPVGRDVLPSVASCAVALGGYVYGSMSLEAASFLGKGSASVASSPASGLDV